MRREATATTCWIPAGCRMGMARAGYPLPRRDGVSSMAPENLARPLGAYLYTRPLDGVRPPVGCSSPSTVRTYCAAVRHAQVARTRGSSFLSPPPTSGPEWRPQGAGPRPGVASISVWRSCAAAITAATLATSVTAAAAATAATAAIYHCC